MEGGGCMGGIRHDGTDRLRLNSAFLPTTETRSVFALRARLRLPGTVFAPDLKITNEISAHKKSILQCKIAGIVLRS